MYVSISIKVTRTNVGRGPSLGKSFRMLGANQFRSSGGYGIMPLRFWQRERGIMKTRKIVMRVERILTDFYLAIEAVTVEHINRTIDGLNIRGKIYFKRSTRLTLSEKKVTHSCKYGPIENARIQCQERGRKKPLFGNRLTFINYVRITSKTLDD
jgi:hypothetical protein